MNLFKHLCRTNGKAVLISTHELDLALQSADRIWLANRDKTIWEGIPEDLVLSGEIDRVFGLKGFSLKTGKIERKEPRARQFKVRGEGYALLWTRNALERTGFEADHEDGEEIRVEESEGTFRWYHGDRSFVDLQSLLESL